MFHLPAHRRYSDPTEDGGDRFWSWLVRSVPLAAVLLVGWVGIVIATNGGIFACGLLSDEKQVGWAARGGAVLGVPLLIGTLLGVIGATVATLDLVDRRVLLFAYVLVFVLALSLHGLTIAPAIWGLTRCVQT